jgi:hypothetical protein
MGCSKIKRKNQTGSTFGKKGTLTKKGGKKKK